MNARLHHLIVTLAAGACLAGAAYGEGISDAGQSGAGARVDQQPKPTPVAAASQPGSTQVQNVLQNLHQDNQMEIMMGQLAQEKAESDAVREYGRMLVEDHQQVQSKVEELAAQQQVALTPPTPSEIQASPATDQDPMAQQHQDMDRLRALSGREFDREFVKTMAQDHQKTIQELRAARKTLSANTEVTQLVNQVIPKLEQHLKRAKQLQRQTQGS